MEKYNVIRDLERGPVRSASLAQEGSSRPSSWAQTPPNIDIFDKKSPMYYKKVDPLTNIDFSRVIPGERKKTPTTEDGGAGAVSSKMEKKDTDCPAIEE